MANNNFNDNCNVMTNNFTSNLCIVSNYYTHINHRLCLDSVENMLLVRQAACFEVSNGGCMRTMLCRVEIKAEKSPDWFDFLFCRISR